MSQRKKLLWYKTRMPGCVRDGTSTVSLNLAQCLAAEFDIDLVTLRITGKEDAAAEAVCPPFKRVIVVNPDNVGSILTRLAYRVWYTVLSWWRAVPRAVLYASGPAATHALRKQFARVRYDLAVFEYFNTASLLPLASCPTVLIVIDATFQTLAEACAEGSGLMQWLRRRDVEIMRRFECGMAAYATACFAISPRDIELLNRAGNTHAIEHLPVVFPPIKPRELGGGCVPPEQPMRVCFMGNLDYAENSNALAWLLAFVWPQVRKRVPDAELVLLGGGSLNRFAKARESCGVRQLGWVEDLGSMLATCRCGVAPSVSGTGVKIKVLDMLWHGVPTVATSIAAAGTPAATGAAYVADTADQFADYVVTLLLDQESRERLRASALAAMEATHCGLSAREAVVARFRKLVQG